MTIATASSATAPPAPRRAPPTPVLGLADARSLSAHWQHACAVLVDGSVVCWGSNSSGQLGDGTQVNRAQPVAVPNLQNVVAVATGLSHTCAMTAGAIRCWGDNSQGQLGSNASGASGAMVQPTLVPIVIDPVAIAAGAQHTCAVRLNGQVLCWGQNSSGQLGEGSMSSLAEPVPVTGLTNGVKVTAGATFSCAATNDGAIFCWGDDHYGQLGTGHDVFRPVATTIALSADQVTAGGAHSCAVGHAVLPGDADGFVCWGSEQAGQLGDNGDERSFAAGADRAAAGPGRHLRRRAAQLRRRQVGRALVLGARLERTARTRPPGRHALSRSRSRLPSGANQATAVAGGGAHSCVLVDPADGLGGEIFCFGDNSYGQLGDGTLTSRPTPALVSLGPTAVRATAVTAGGGHTCAIDVTGQPWCWGRNDSGQLGRRRGSESTDADAGIADGRRGHPLALGRRRPHLRRRPGGRRLVLGRR